MELNKDNVSRREMNMVARAAKNRWPISTSTKNKAIKQIIEYLKSNKLSPRELSSLTKCLIACESQNQVDQLQKHKDERLDSGLATENTQIIIEVPKPRDGISVK